VHVRPRRLHSLLSLSSAYASAGKEASPLEETTLIAGVLAGEPLALAELHDRFALPVLRILMRILGPDHELNDLHHDVFVRALSSLAELRDPRALRGWMSAIAVHTARASIERRVRRRRWVFLPADDVMPEPEATDPSPSHEAREALRAAYALLDRLPVAERIAFALRYFEQMELSEIATACDISLASVKRRLTRAESRFVALARRTPALTSYLEGGARWSQD
jgi:RNA polymerase sigma-70 factor (ECF subfamily)